ncbi:phosphate acetyltransferase [Gephyromycinifex aptenodytis]|uniref:phosphate acetyltransferase n=1 Tax=Gephyromycinifex aptenodytis TaxID=2716227 RepID=UPI0014457AB4|nr:phosphate acetyltransferase [Gephyromycinifex aptenodytis]
MSRRILLVPAHPHVGLTAACLGLAHALDERGVDVGYAKPLAQTRHHGGSGHAGELFRLTTPLRPPEPVPAQRVQELLSEGRIDSLMLEMLATCEDVLDQHELVLLEGLAPGEDQALPEHVNVELSRALDAHVLIVGSARGKDPSRLANQLAAMAGSFNGPAGSRVIGAVVNRIEHEDDHGHGLKDPEPLVAPYREALAEKGLRLAAGILVDDELARPRVRDLTHGLGLQVINHGDDTRRIGGVAIAAQSVPGFLPSLVAGRLILVPGDRHEVLLSAALAEMSGTRLAAVVLTADVRPDPQVLELCRPALGCGLPVLFSRAKTFETAAQVLDLDPEIPADDEDRARRVMQIMATAYDETWLAELKALPTRIRITPAHYELATRHALGRGRYTVALAEGSAPAQVAAAVALSEASRVRCVLVASTTDVTRTAAELGLDLPPDVLIVDPQREDKRLVIALRSVRPGLSAAEAGELLRDPLTTALLLLKIQDVDGVVGGELHGSRPLVGLAEEIIGRRSDVMTVSSSHLMMLPDGVVAYADCVVVSEPSGMELACIASQTANAVERVRIPARVAFVAPSRAHADAPRARARVQEAVAMIRDRRPDLIVDGPLPFEAAASVAKARLLTPDSPLQGQATVFVFPDLATGNATYKAVRRSSGAHVIGPILQGLNKPVNAPPRDASVSEVIDTVVATALQASQLG